jgi:predicted amidohydrolase YtcJ
MPLLARDAAPDLILFNGHIATLHADLPRASAIACKDGRVHAVGDDDAVRALAGPATELIDLGGRTVVPGINDAHNHMLELGLKLSKLQLESCTSIAEMVELLRAWADRTPEGEWIVGEGWNESLFAEGRLPSRLDLDAATTRHPVLLKRFFNMDVVNSRALELAGVTADTPDPAGGRIEHLPDGTPSGILRAAAKVAVRSLLPRPTEQECVAALDAAGRAYLAHGITSVLEPGLEPWEIRAYLQARRQGTLHQRANLMPSWHGFREGDDPRVLDDRAAGLGLFSGFGDEWLSLGALKMAVDGGTTSRTAWMFQPFVGENKVHDYNRLDPEDLREFFGRGHELGWDIGIHAIGDRAHHESALAFADTLAGSQRADHRHNLIHAYFATEESLQHMARHGIAAVIQPTFIYYEGDDLFRDVGEELAHRYKPMRTYLDRGIRVVATSDIPSTVHYNPFVGLYSLVTRRTWKGTPIAPQEAVTREEALHAYTVAGAWLTREEGIKGPLAPGYLADLAVLDRDYFTCPEEEIKEIAVELTVVGGRVAYRREA